MRSQTNKIVALDPQHPLLAAHEPTAETEFKRRQHPRDEAAIGPQYQADPQVDDAHAILGGRTRRVLPGLAQFVAETGVRFGGLGEHLILPEAIPADRRTADQHGRLAFKTTY